jgi:hypothetical protein
MVRIVGLILLLSALLTGVFLRDEAPPTSQPTIDAGCEADPNGRPCLPGS